MGYVNQVIKAFYLKIFNVKSNSYMWGLLKWFITVCLIDNEDNLQRNANKFSKILEICSMKVLTNKSEAIAVAEIRRRRDTLCGS